MVASLVSSFGASSTSALAFSQLFKSLRSVAVWTTSITWPFLSPADWSTTSNVGSG